MKWNSSLRKSSFIKKCHTNVELESIVMCYSNLVHSSNMWNTTLTQPQLLTYFFLMAFVFVSYSSVWVSLFSFFCQDQLGWEATIVDFFFFSLAFNFVSYSSKFGLSGSRGMGGHNCWLIFFFLLLLLVANPYDVRESYCIWM